jgi:hypothetical protein
VALAVLLKPVFPVVEYALHYDYISEVLCVNKDKPMLHCNGKCHLMKELAKAAESEKPISSDKKGSVKQETETLYCVGLSDFVMQPLFAGTSTKVPDSYINLYQRLVGAVVYHPPTFS